MSTPRPNFFIVGAPKCGTTAMATYLGEHDRIFMSTPKEPHYFASDIVDHVVRPADPSPEWYQSLFDDAGDAPVIGEASVFHLFSKVAASRIRDSYPDAKVLVMLRNPVDLVHSFHSQLLYTGQEKERDFERAWKRQPQPGASVLLDYRAMGKLGEQLERLLSIFDRDQVLVIIFDDFRHDPAGQYQRVLRFLELPPDGRKDFPVVNPNRSHRSQLLRLLINVLPDPGPIKRLLGIQSIGVADRLKSLNRKRHRRRPLSSQLRSELTEFFAADVRLLSSLTHCDLGHWIR